MVAVRKSHLAAAKRVKSAEFRDRLQSAETPNKWMSAMESGFEQGWNALLNALLDEGVLQWAPEPPLKAEAGNAR